MTHDVTVFMKPNMNPLLFASKADVKISFFRTKWWIWYFHRSSAIWRVCSTGRKEACDRNFNNQSMAEAGSLAELENNEIIRESFCSLRTGLESGWCHDGAAPRQLYLSMPARSFRFGSSLLLRLLSLHLVQSISSYMIRGINKQSIWHRKLKSYPQWTLIMFSLWVPHSNPSGPFRSSEGVMWNNAAPLWPGGVHIALDLFIYVWKKVTY